ncbi:sigma-54-dependent transcriptional regulator [Rhizosphaericola mali]|uniref:Sigma-54-dependent Fis family transcriptional regulator n=1 Tax=Rhizosphaericola mali TaxID=2545455 RepID=A0A5P2G1P7_9BACT|nr:sigma-54 dependent transcriptional regulator [Rhizosphaericola mali]QES89097.1 sigma-54-dependent Fis family transcriptional regulator [Rhizosphaericola mali]
MNLKQATILVIDDDTDVLTAVRLLLKPLVKSIIVDKQPDAVLELIKKNEVDILILDMNFRASINTGNEGLYWLSTVKRSFPDLPIIMITAYADIDLAITSLKSGATDFIVKPWHNEKLLENIKNVLQGKGNKKEQRANFQHLLGESMPMQNIFRKLEKIAPTDANILILGENGTGKDLIASAIHEQSLRYKEAYIKADLGALTETLFESELFGYKKGAFTDAREDRLGRFQSANKGTLFLDEIGNISLSQQARLLTVLQNRQVTPLGSSTPISVDIRLICATNTPMSELANEQKFRKDLIYRINTVEINVPPLRERGDDILILANYFLQFYCSKYQKSEMVINDATKIKLLHYPFPGNVRELQYTIERAVIMAESPILTPEDMLFSPLEKNTILTQSNHNTSNLETLEKETIVKVIEKHNGNISRAAKELGLTRTALYRRLNKYDL